MFKADGIGRKLARDGVLSVECRGFNYAEGYPAGNGVGWDIAITSDFPAALIALAIASCIVIRDLRSP